MLYTPSTMFLYSIIPMFKHAISIHHPYFLAPCSYLRVEPHTEPLSSCALYSTFHLLHNVLHTLHLLHKHVLRYMKHERREAMAQDIGALLI